MPVSDIYFATRRGAKYCDEHVCLFVCLSVHISQPHGQTSPMFLCMLPMAMTCSSSDSIAMLCTSGFEDGVMFSYHGASGPELSTTFCLEEVRQVAVPVESQATTVFAQVHQNVAIVAKSA